MSEKFSGFKGEAAARDTTYALVGNGDVELGRKRIEAQNADQTHENFVRATQELWTDFAVHGFVRENSVSHEKELDCNTDLDGKTALGLLSLTGMDVKKVKYVAPGDFVEGAINVDTGKRGGVTFEPETQTTFFDHHLENNDPEHISATDLVYKTIMKLDLLKNSEYSKKEAKLIEQGKIKDPEYLEKMVEFVNHVDNKNFPDQEKYFNNSYKHLLGLSRYVTFEKQLQFFQDGLDPTQELSQDELKQYGFIYANSKGKSINRAQDRKRIVEESINTINEIKKDGYIVNSKKFGDILVDRHSKVPAGADAAYAAGCSVYIKWCETGFFISSKIPFDDSFDLGEGIKVRDNMYLKPDDGQPLNIDLGQVLDKMDASY